VVSSPVRALQSAIADRARRIIAGDGGPPPDLFVPGDAGLFGPDSETWRVHGDISILIGGVRALLLQTLHPLAMAGVADHSDYRADPLGRLHRTSSFLGRTVFGSTAVAEAALAKVRAIHERVEGVAPDGRPYRAGDPHLLGWVHATELDSFLVAHQRYGSDPLSPAGADTYVAEMARIGLALGMTSAPRSAAELDEVLESYRPELASTEQGRGAVRFLVSPPLPLAARPAYRVMFAAATGLLSPSTRRMLRLPLPPLTDPLLIRPAATAIIRTLGWALGTSQARAAAVQRAASTG
jgi:uncharacterized protein (DUF2236 family)